MTVVWVVILFGTVAWAYVWLARHLNATTPPCAHQRVQVPDGELDECSRCGKVLR